MIEIGEAVWVIREDRNRNKEGIRWIVKSGMTLPRGEKVKTAIRAYPLA
jgi:hypothetical protein